MQHADEKNLFRLQLVEDQMAVKARHPKTSDAGGRQVFPSPANFWMLQDQFKSLGDGVCEADCKLRRNLAGKGGDDFCKIVFKNRAERAFRSAPARALAAISRSRARFPGRRVPASP